MHIKCTLKMNSYASNTAEQEVIFLFKIMDYTEASSISIDTILRIFKNKLFIDEVQVCLYLQFTHV